MDNSDRRATIREILTGVRDAGALDDNNGAENWSLSDKRIDEACDQLRDWFIELLPKKKIQYVIFGKEAYIKYQNANLEISGFNAAIDQMSAAINAELSAGHEAHEPGQKDQEPDS